MENKEPIMGFVTYLEKEYPFIYEEETLKLMPASVEEWEKEKFKFWTRLSEYKKNINKNAWIENISLCGRANNGKI